MIMIPYGFGFENGMIRFCFTGAAFTSPMMIWNTTTLYRVVIVVIIIAVANRETVCEEEMIFDCLLFMISLTDA